MAYFGKFEANETFSSQAEQVMELIQNGLNVYPAYSGGKAIILVGLTGSGKTTLAKFITGDNSRLVSKAAFIEADYTSCPEQNNEIPTPTDYYDDDEVNTDCKIDEIAKEYYIQDLDDDKIGNDITISKTFYPEAYVDEMTGEVLVDCPGFEDTRSESHEIANAVFMKSIFKWATQTKIVIVVNYSDVTRTGGRNEVRNMLQFVTTLLKNYQTFNTSIGLVATKVPNEYNSEKKVISDEAMIAPIATFLKSVYDELLLQDPFDTKINVLETLLKQIASRYPNIGIFRRTYEEGPLQNMQDLQIGKKKIRKMFFKNLRYANSTESDIGFAISAASEAVVIDLCERIQAEMNTLLTRFYNNVFEYYNTVVENSRNYEQLSVQLKKDSQSYQSCNLNLSVPIESQLNCFFEVLLVGRVVSYYEVRSTVETIRNQTTLLYFLKKLTTSPKVVTPYEIWETKITSTLAQYVRNLADWFEFLVHAFKQMAQNSFQSRKTEFNFFKLKEWSEFKRILLDDLKLPSNSSISRKNSLEQLEQKSLEDVLHVLLDPVAHSFTGPGYSELQIEGHFVRLSDIEKLASLYGDKVITATYLFAHHTVFIDANLSRVGSEMLLAVVAPKWEVIGSQNITLSGSPGKVLPQSNSGDGEAGFAGGPSGTFFGVVSDFSNATSLQIFTNGGDGGNGQMGMNGRINYYEMSENEGNLIFEKIYVRSNFSGTALCIQDCDKSGKFSNFTYQVTCKQLNYREDTESKLEEILVHIRQKVDPEAIAGYNGGRQGLRGKASKINQIINLKGKSGSKIYNEDGSLGASGKGGKGGLGTVNGGFRAKFELHCMSSCILFPMTFLPKDNETTAKCGKDGLDNFSGTQKKPKPVKPQNFYSIITKYRLFVTNRKFLNARWIDSAVFEFIENISLNPEIQGMINLKDLIGEFIALEDISKHLPCTNEWLSYLDLLLQSIEAARQIHTNFNSTSFAVVAHYLSAAILSRKLSIEYQFDKNLIVDVHMFLNEVSRQIEKLAGLDHGAKLKALNLTYGQNIIMKQQLSDLFLNQQFPAELALIEAKIQTSTTKLRDKVTSLLDQFETDRIKFSKLIEEAQLKFELNIIFEFLSSVGQLLSIVNPTAGKVGTVLNVGVGLFQKYKNSKSDVVPTTQQLPQAIQTLVELDRKLKAENENKTLLLEARLENLTSENPQEQQVLDTAKAKLKDLIGTTQQFSIVQIELSSVIENQRREKNLMNSELLDRFQTSIFLFRNNNLAAYENLHKKTYLSTKIEKTPSEVEKMKQGLKDVEANIKKVASYEKYVEDSLSVYIQNLAKLMVSIKDGTRQSSAIPLEISRFNIQKNLLEVRSIINKYTAGFSANEELIVCIDMLDNLMRTTINVYDQIQKYNDQTNLGNLIVEINKAGLTGLKTNDEQLDAAVQLLDNKIVSNTIQNQYIRVVQAFQQLVFPFAFVFLPDLLISDNGYNSTKDDQVLQLMITKINDLQTINNGLRSSIIEGYDDQLFSFNFDEEHPFYVWNEVQHQQNIKALLRGEECYFKSKVVRSVADAVKFLVVRLKFVAAKASEQTRLDAHLNQTNIRLTHSGNSQYKCGDRYYVIAHQQQVIEMSVATDDNGEPVLSNAVYQKIRNGNYLLSPYTSWKIQIVHRFGEPLNLSHLFGKVKLKLVGKGQFIKKNNPICNQKLEQFYQLDEIQG